MTAGLYKRYGKPAFDRAASALGLVLLAPFLLAVAAAIRMTSGSPVFFRHRRPGLHSRPFTLVKFRTMTDARDEEGRLLPDAARTTRLGRLLRTLSIDELPELYNVLRGDMSLIGPRPLLMQHLERYDAHQVRRHDVLPGITGWAHTRYRAPVDDLSATHINLGMGFEF
jgi:lipopolysaccharide/colanic/teichoic acid biosynthesis glycosyltransferase